MKLRLKWSEEEDGKGEEMIWVVKANPLTKNEEFGKKLAKNLEVLGFYIGKNPLVREY
jgi:hypothetical protein